VPVTGRYIQQIKKQFRNNKRYRQLGQLSTWRKNKQLKFHFVGSEKDRPVGIVYDTAVPLFYARTPAKMSTDRLWRLSRQTTTSFAVTIGSRRPCS